MYEDFLKETITKAVCAAFDYEDGEKIIFIEEKFNGIKKIVNAQKDRAKLVSENTIKQIYENLRKCSLLIQQNIMGSTINNDIACHILTTLTFDIIFEKCKEITETKKKKDGLGTLDGFINKYNEFIKGFINEYIRHNLENTEPLNIENFKKILQTRKELKNKLNKKQQLTEENNAIIDIMIGCIADEYINNNETYYSTTPEIIKLFEEKKYDELCDKLLKKIGDRQQSDFLKEVIDTFKSVLIQNSIIKEDEKTEAQQQNIFNSLNNSVVNEMIDNFKYLDQNEKKQEKNDINKGIDLEFIYADLEVCDEKEEEIKDKKTEKTEDKKKEEPKRKKVEKKQKKEKKAKKRKKSKKIEEIDEKLTKTTENKKKYRDVKSTNRRK